MVIFTKPKTKRNAGKFMLAVDSLFTAFDIYASKDDVVNHILPILPTRSFGYKPLGEDSICKAIIGSGNAPAVTGQVSAI